MKEYLDHSIELNGTLYVKEENVWHTTESLKPKYDGYILSRVGGGSLAQYIIEKQYQEKREAERKQKLNLIEKL